MWISFHSYKGGTGKTNIVGNMAAYLASNKYKVAVFDTDVAGPGLHSLFNIKPDKTLVDYLTGKCEIGSIVYQPSPPRKLYLIPSTATEEDLTSFFKDPADAKNRLMELIRTVESDYGIDHVLVDCSPGINKSSLLVMGMTNLSIVVCTLDKQDIRGTYVISGVARRMKARTSIIFNKLPKSKYGSAKSILEEFSRRLNMDILGTVFYDEIMANAWSRKIMVDSYPDSQFSLQIGEIADNIISMEL